MKRWLLILGRLGLGGIFLYAGYVKGIQQPWPNFAISIESWKLVPETWLEPIARILPWVEMVLGLATITGVFTRWFSASLTAMLAFFLGLGVWGYATDKHPDCGCFGTGSSEGLDFKWFSEHVAMLALGLLVTVGYFLAARKRAPVYEMSSVAEAATDSTAGAVAGD